MLKLRTFLFLIMIAFNLNAQQLTIDDIFRSSTYSAQGSSQIRFLNTSSDYTQLNNTDDGYQALEVFNIADGKKTASILYSKELDQSLYFNSYRFSNDDQMLLLATERERIYRYSTQAYNYIYDIKQEQLTALDEERKQMYPHFSPDNEKVGYIVGNDLFYKNLSDGTIKQISFDGRENHIINGRPDWVYEEEFALQRMYEWSEDGKHLIFLQSDESQVPEFSILHYDENYPYTESFKYPRAGEKNSDVLLKVYDVAADTLITLDIPYDYEYIPRIIQAGEGFAFMLLNRHQNHMRIVYYNPKTQSFRKVYEYTHPQYVDEPSVFDYIGDGKYMLASDRDGYLHIYIVSSGKVSPVTFGQFEVSEFYGMDENGWIYYQSSAKASHQRHIYKLNLKTGEEKIIASDPGYNDARFAGNYKYFVNTYSAQGTPPVISVIDNDGHLVRTIEDNKALKGRLEKFWKDREFITIDVGDHEIEAWMIKPPDFDENKKYPVFNFIYGGPGNQRVRDEYFGSLGLWFQLLAQQGYIILCADNRGTPGRGSEFLKSNYLQMGKVEVEDQLLIIDHLNNLPYVDGKRIGYYGWSYGGYMSLLMLFQSEGAVKTALSVAPVTHWKFYDTIYTERFMRTPKENSKAYDDGSPLNSVDQWKSGTLFIAHGTADDNVHFQNTTELIKEMNRLDKHYEVYFYPDGAHGMGSYHNRVHLFEKMTAFILENL